MLGNFSISENSSIEDACKILHRNKIVFIGCCRIQRSNNLVGIITERDVIEDISIKAAHLKVKLKTLSSKIVKVSPGNTTDEAMDLMIDNQIRHLAVMENDKLLGVVSMKGHSKEIQLVFQ